MLGYVMHNANYTQSCSVLFHEKQFAMPLLLVIVSHEKGGDVQFTISSTHSSRQKKGSTPTLWREMGNENFERRLVKLD